ncbi:MAG: PAS domain S-box protein, partial [Magnetococcus sp. YQC-5]
MNNEPFSKILVVDDRAANRLALRRLLKEVPADILEAGSGSEALGVVLEGHDLAMILLDVDMPDMDGYEVAEMIKGVRESRHIPIIFITAAFKDHIHRMRGYRAGGVDYIEKPIDDEILLSKVGVFLELHDMRQKQARSLALLRQSEAKFRTMVDHIAVGIVRANLEGTILEANPAFCAMLGYAPQELINRPLSAISHPDDMQRNFVQLQALLAGTIPSFQMEKRYFAKDGCQIWGNLTVTLILGNAGKPDFFLAAIENITQRKQMELKLRQLSQAVEQSPVSIVITDPKGTIQYVNPRFCQVTGYTLEEAIGQNPRLLKSGRTTQEEYQWIWQQITTGNEWHGEFFNKRKNGEYYWENAVITAILDADGNITHFLGVKEEITQRKLAEKALHQSELRFRMLAEQAQDIIYRYCFDPPGFEYVSPSVTKLTGYTQEEHYADPQLGLKLVHPEDRHLLERIEESFTQPIVMRWLCKDQSILWTEQRNTPTFDDQGRLLAIDGIARDITQRKRDEGELRDVHRQLKASEERLRSIMDNAPAVMFVKDLVGRY